MEDSLAIMASKIHNGLHGLHIFIHHSSLIIHHFISITFLAVDPPPSRNEMWSLSSNVEDICEVADNKQKEHIYTQQ